MIQEMNFFLWKAQKKKIVLHAETNNTPYATPKKLFDDIQEFKNFIFKYILSAKIIISTTVLRDDKANANENN